ncbi:hypothetical protein Tco_1153302 [Tanacetum coccineum]
MAAQNKQERNERRQSEEEGQENMTQRADEERKHGKGEGSRKDEGLGDPTGRTRAEPATRGYAAESKRERNPKQQRGKGRVKEKRQKERGEEVQTTKLRPDEQRDRRRNSDQGGAAEQRQRKTGGKQRDRSNRESKRGRRRDGSQKAAVAHGRRRGEEEKQQNGKTGETYETRQKGDVQREQVQEARSRLSEGEDERLLCERSIRKAVAEIERHAEDRQKVPSARCEQLGTRYSAPSENTRAGAEAPQRSNREATQAHGRPKKGRDGTERDDPAGNAGETARGTQTGDTKNDQTASRREEGARVQRERARARTEEAKGEQANGGKPHKAGSEGTEKTSEGGRGEERRQDAEQKNARSYKRGHTREGGDDKEREQKRETTQERRKREESRRGVEKEQIRSEGCAVRTTRNVTRGGTPVETGSEQHRQTHQDVVVREVGEELPPESESLRATEEQWGNEEQTEVTRSGSAERRRHKTDGDKRNPKGEQKEKAEHTRQCEDENIGVRERGATGTHLATPGPSDDHAELGSHTGPAAAPPGPPAFPFPLLTFLPFYLPSFSSFPTHPLSAPLIPLSLHSFSLPCSLRLCFFFSPFSFSPLPLPLSHFSPLLFLPSPSISLLLPFYPSSSLPPSFPPIPLSLPLLLLPFLLFSLLLSSPSPIIASSLFFAPSLPLATFPLPLLFSLLSLLHSPSFPFPSFSYPSSLPRSFLLPSFPIAIRNRPPTRTQLRNQMMTYLKHVGNKKHSDLKNKTFEEIQALYEKVKRFDESFTAVGSTEDERKIKEMNEGAKDLEQKRLKKKVAKETPKKEDTAKVPAKVDVTEQGTKKRKGGHMKMIARKRKRPQPDVDSNDEHRECLKIVTFEGTIDSEIMERKSVITRLNKVSSPDGDYLVIYRANGNFRAFNYLLEVLHIFDRQDLFHLYEISDEACSTLEVIMEGIELILWRFEDNDGILKRRK